MDSSNRNGERYGYRVRAYSGDYTSKASTAQSITYLTAPKLSKLKNTGKRAVTVQWKKNSGASGYQIYYGQTSRFKKAKMVTVPKGKSTKTVLKKLQKKKTYYIRIRAYQTVSGKRSYSLWSSSRTVIVKSKSPGNGQKPVDETGRRGYNISKAGKVSSANLFCTNCRCTALSCPWR